MRRAIASFLTMLALGLIASGVSVARAQGPSQERLNSEAQALTERLHAPCCHDQLLDRHDSEPARALRREIRARLAQGASPDQVERELVRRYGSWIVAVPKDRDPRAGISVALMIGLAGTAMALTMLGVRWVRKDREASVKLDSTRLAPATASGRAEQLDARLEAELRRMDD